MRDRCTVSTDCPELCICWFGRCRVASYDCGTTSVYGPHMSTSYATSLTSTPTQHMSTTKITGHSTMTRLTTGMPSHSTTPPTIHSTTHLTHPSGTTTRPDLQSTIRTTDPSQVGNFTTTPFMTTTTIPEGKDIYCDEDGDGYSDSCELHSCTLPCSCLCGICVLVSVP